jgi:hypothetical protein
MQTQINKFILCLQKEQFFNAHEVLEEIWFPRRFEENVDIQLLKGFINAAVSFELYKRGRKQQSKKVWANYLKYRPLLLDSKCSYRNDFYQLSRYIEQINHKNH